MKLHINVAIQIQKPVDVVFEAIVNPDQMSQYFISKSNGKMEEGKSLVWNFPEFDADAPVRVGKIIANELITFYWEINQVEVEVEMQLQQKPDGSTVIRIIEKEMDNNDAGMTNCEYRLMFSKQIYSRINHSKYISLFIQSSF